MKLIIGLGNPGEKYENNRHNVGHLAVDKLSKTPKLKNSRQIKILKSENFMNNSGDFVKKLVDQYKINLSDLWIIHDDLDIHLGDYKIQFGVGPKVHNGILSIEEKLGTKGFWRVRIGIDNRDPEDRIPGDEYVLQDFKKKELDIINETIRKTKRSI